MDRTILQPLKQISRYKIERVLGSGAMGMVYQGFDTQIERPVAIKVLHPHLLMNEGGDELEKRFMQEARAAARCLHGNIVAIFDFGVENGISYIVMEYVDGTELKAHLSNETPISPSSATTICIQILEALSHAHSNGVVHRDIKPANIMLLEDGTVKVSDFGVARLDTSDLTGTGYMVGTPNYMSPEGHSGETVDQRSDIYSVGVLLYELIALERPDRFVSLNESLARIDQVAGLSVASAESIKSILSRAMQNSPDDRFQTANEFIQALKDIADINLAEATLVRFPRLAKREASAFELPAGQQNVSQVDDELLKSLEHSLAEHVGPMAKMLVKKQSKKAESLQSLVASLANYIPNDGERTQFLKRVSRSGVSTLEQSLQTSVDVAQVSVVQAGQTSLAEENIEAISKLLAFHVGPLAGRIMKKVMRSTTEPNALLAQLASHIPDEAEQKAFVEKVKKLL